MYMGLFSRTKPIELSVEQVPGWLDTYLEKKDNNLVVKQFHQDFANKKGVLARKLDFVEGRYPSTRYAEIIREFFINNELPNSHMELSYVIEEYAQNIGELISETQKEYFTLLEKSPQDIMPAHQKLLDIEKIVVEMVAYFEKIGLEDVRAVKKAYNHFKETEVRIAKIQELIRDEDRKRREPLERLEKIQVRKEKLVGTKSYEVYQEFVRKKAKLMKELDEIGGEYIELMKELHDPMEQFIDLDGRDKVISHYLRDPVGALVTDTSLVILEVIKEMKKHLAQELKDKTKIMTKKWLQTQQKNLKDKQVEFKMVDNRMKKDSISMMVREQEGYEEAVNEALDEIEKNKEVLLNELERTSLQLAWQRLRDSLKKLDKNIILEAI